MRAFTVDVAAAALGVERKFLDNLLSRHHFGDGPGAHGSSGDPAPPPRRQGRRRRLTSPMVAELAVAITLARELGVPLAAALHLAAALRPDGRVVRGALTLTIDRPALERALAQRLAIALEGVREPRRGRPPRRGA